MVMAAFGAEVVERAIREKSDCDEEGTDREKLARAARQFGFGRSRAEEWGTDPHTGSTQLQALLAQGIYPIVYLKMPPPFPTHAVIVLSVTEDKVRVLDPYHGPRSLLKQQFIEEWTLTRQKIIIIE